MGATMGRAIDIQMAQAHGFLAKPVGAHPVYAGVLIIALLVALVILIIIAMSQAAKIKKGKSSMLGGSNLSVGNWATGGNNPNWGAGAAHAGAYGSTENGPNHPHSSWSGVSGDSTPWSTPCSAASSGVSARRQVEDQADVAQQEGLVRGLSEEELGTMLGGTGHGF